MEQTERAVSEDHRGTTGNAGTSRTRGSGGAGAPAWQAPLHPLNLADLVVHAGEGIAWAGGHGTYSPEFEEFRDHPDEAFARVIALGLAPGAALALRQQVTGAMRAAGILDAGGEVINAGYVEAQQQQDIFAHVGGGLGDQLWALLRYARAIGL
ncbi:hypothetical protein DEW08_28120 (plasmid) [Azospirillum thermophilum]|uniref:Uncharacterized protein n=2 Tax=Azospirillum thermophilum TaxID=2202148 RepID=A0A2S2CZG6_9PROT|nr:hypothetical protein DEW08_28120 [Azospirillum thermophilum]